MATGGVALLIKVHGGEAMHVRSRLLHVSYRLLCTRPLFDRPLFLTYVTHWSVASFESQQISLLISSLLMFERLPCR
jgi:hypothetical protein